MCAFSMFRDAYHVGQQQNACPTTAALLRQIDGRGAGNERVLRGNQGENAFSSRSPRYRTG